MRNLLTYSILILALQSNAATIIGSVVDKQTNKIAPLLVTVTPTNLVSAVSTNLVVEPSQSKYTDGNGAFSFSLFGGVYDVNLKDVGTLRIKLDVGDTNTYSISTVLYVPPLPLYITNQVTVNNLGGGGGSTVYLTPLFGIKVITNTLGSDYSISLSNKFPVVDSLLLTNYQGSNIIGTVSLATLATTATTANGLASGTYTYDGSGAVTILAKTAITSGSSTNSTNWLGLLKTNNVSGVPTTGLIPKIQPDGSVSWDTDISGGSLPGNVLTNGETVATTFSNNVTVDATHQFNGNGVGLTGLLIANIVQPGFIVTNGETLIMTFSNNVIIDATHTLTAVGSGLTSIPMTGLVQPGAIVTNGETLAITFSNNVIVDATHQFSGSGAGLTSIPMTGIIQPGAIATNGESLALTFSNNVTVDAGHSFVGSLNGNASTATSATTATTAGNLTVGTLVNVVNGFNITNLNVNNMESPTNTTAGSTVVDFSIFEATTNMAANLTFTALSNVNPTNNNKAIRHIIANGADRTIAFPASWKSQGVCVATNGTTKDLYIEAQVGFFTNVSYKSNW